LSFRKKAVGRFSFYWTIKIPTFWEPATSPNWQKSWFKNSFQRCQSYWRAFRGFL